MAARALRPGSFSFEERRNARLVGLSKGENAMKKLVKVENLRLLAAGLCLTTLVSCNGLNSREESMLTGAAIGTGVGAAAAGITGGNVGTGALIGAGAGAVGGYLVDRNRW
jgi:osmotically inducible lipoprotein OsmB